MIQIPSVQPELLRALETDFGTTIAAAIWRKIKDQEHYINASVPVGLIVWFYSDQYYASGSRIDKPSVNNWQFCDGSPILSGPLIGQNVPDLRGWYPLHGGTIGNTGGQAGFSLPAHNHGGQTTYSGDCNTGSLHTDPGGDKYSCIVHSHPFPQEAQMNFSLNPNHIELQPYMRIL